MNEEGWWRMAVRRALGNRALPRQKTRVAAAESYLVAHACFACRKSFKIHPPQDSVLRCSQCGGEIHWMGRSFKAPPMVDVKQWHKVQALYAHGFRFFSYRSNPGAVPLPERLSDIARFVRAHPRHPFRVAQPDERLLPVGWTKQL